MSDKLYVIRNQKNKEQFWRPIYGWGALWQADTYHKEDLGVVGVPPCGEWCELYGERREGTPTPVFKVELTVGMLKRMLNQFSDDAHVMMKHHEEETGDQEYEVSLFTDQDGNVVVAASWMKRNLEYYNDHVEVK